MPRPMILFSPCKLAPALDATRLQPVRHCACTRPCGARSQPKERAQEAQAA
jgi:hypothetical protein